MNEKNISPKAARKERKKKKQAWKYKAQNKMVEINPDISINIISVNGPNAVVKRLRLSKNTFL